jgi:hypothetical protein
MASGCFGTLAVAEFETVHSPQGENRIDIATISGRLKRLGKE